MLLSTLERAVRVLASEPRFTGMSRVDKNELKKIFDSLHIDDMIRELEEQMPKDRVKSWRFLMEELKTKIADPIEKENNLKTNPAIKDRFILGILCYIFNTCNNAHQEEKNQNHMKHR